MIWLRGLVDGQWHPALAPDDPRALRLRQRPTTYRDWLTPDGAPGPEGQPAHRAEPGRYHLYVSHACPWAHRAILYRRLKGLEEVVSMSVLHPRMAGPESWRFEPSPWSTEDHLYGYRRLYDVYRRGDPAATTVVTVPMLWDRAQERIVNCESGDILRILARAFGAWGDPEVCFRPSGRAGEIEVMNAFVLRRVCTAVYRVGFARSQAAYDRAVEALFRALDELESRLARQPCLLGREVTEPDWHLFCTLVRFDAAYHGALRCSRRRLIDYPALADYTRRLYQHPGVAGTVDLAAIAMHYHDDHAEIDRRIVPAPPAVDFRDADARGGLRFSHDRANTALSQPGGSMP